MFGTACGGVAASSGVTVAGLLNDDHSVLINGVKYSESKSLGIDADISPDGAHVGIVRVSFSPACSGNEPENIIELVTVATQSHVDSQNMQFASWWGNNEFVAYPTGPTDSGVWIYTLQGKPVSQIGKVNTPSLYQGDLS